MKSHLPLPLHFYVHLRNVIYWVFSLHISVRMWR